MIDPDELPTDGDEERFGWQSDDFEIVPPQAEAEKPPCEKCKGKPNCTCDPQ